MSILFAAPPITTKQFQKNKVYLDVLHSFEQYLQHEKLILCFILLRCHFIFPLAASLSFCGDDLCQHSGPYPLSLRGSVQSMVRAYFGAKKMISFGETYYSPRHPCLWVWMWRSIFPGRQSDGATEYAKSNCLCNANSVGPSARTIRGLRVSSVWRGGGQQRKRFTLQ